MDPRRDRRYVEKIDHAGERLGMVREWLGHASKGAMARLATYKAFQEAAEAAADLAAMALVDSGKPARDDHTNFVLAAKLGVCPEALARPLTEATGLRNVLIHEYDGIEVERALEGIGRLTPAIEAFLTEVERWLSRPKA